jgi:glutathione S-transferase
MMTLYFAPGSSSMAPHIALHEVGAAFEAVPLSFKRKGLSTPAYLAINPEGKVPTLVIDGRPLTEVAAILFYLARTFPEAKLWPETIEEQAQVISWMSFAAATLHPARARGTDHAKAAFAIAERRLDGQEWAVGRYSIADIHLFRLFWRFNGSLRPPRSEFPNLFAHHDRMLARDAVKRTIEVESAVGYELPA